MKVYVATSGPEGEYGYSIEGVFTRREDAEQFSLGDSVKEFDLWDGPVEVGSRHVVEWFSRVFHAPKCSSYKAAQIGQPDSEVDHGWRTVFETWSDTTASEKLAALQTAHLARVKEYVAALPRIDVQVWYEPTPGRVLLFTPLHTSENALAVDRRHVVNQSGLAPDATLHGRWFTVERLALDSVDGFSVCTGPHEGLLASAQMRAKL